MSSSRLRVRTVSLRNQTQIDPLLWFFLVGIIAGVLRSVLRLPGQVYDFVSMLLLSTLITGVLLDWITKATRKQKRNDKS